MSQKFPVDRWFAFEAAALLAAVTWAIAAASTTARADEVIALPHEVEQRIAAAMEQRVSVDFDKKPFGEVLKSLEASLPADHKVSLRLDIDAIAEAEGSVGDAKSREPVLTVIFKLPVTLRAKNVRFGSALSLILYPLEFGWLPTKNGILITTGEKVGNTLLEREYVVTDLATMPPDPLVRSPQDVQERLDQLAGLIKTHTGITTWADDGGAGSAKTSAKNGARLVVKQSRPVHDQIEELLRRLRSKSPDPKSEPDEIATTAALEQRISVNFKATPLPTALRILEDALPAGKKVSLLVDRKGLEDGGTPVDTIAVTLQADEIRLGSMLAHMLGPHDLAFVSRDDVLLVTTRENSDAHISVRIYDVKDLVTPHGRGYDYDSLIDVISTMVAPTTWSETGPHDDMTKVPFGRLAILQTAQVHREIEELLSALRAKPARLGDSTSGTPLAEQQRLREALDQKVAIAAEQSHFSDIINSFAKALPNDKRVPIYLDRQRLQDSYGETEPIITFKAQGASLSEALSLLLGPNDLGWVWSHDAILVTTNEKVCATLDVRTYEIADLLPGSGKDAVGGGDAVATHARRHDDPYHKLIDLIEKCVAPTTWDTVGGPGSIAAFQVGQRLVVSQTHEIQLQVEQFLRDLRDDNLEQRKSPAEVRITAAMEHRLSVDFSAVPLKQALKSLEDALPADKQISFVLNTKELQDVGQDENPPVTLKAVNVQMRSALFLLLRPLDLTFQCRDDSILIYPRGSGCWAEEVRMYNVADIVTAGAKTASHDPQALARLDELTKLIEEQIGPTTWDAVGGPGTIGKFTLKGYRLVISQGPPLHEQIRELLAELRGVPFVADAMLPDAGVSTSERKRLADALDTPVSVDFKDTPLTAAFAKLPDLLPQEKRISILVDKRAFEEAGANPVQEMTLTFAKTPLRDVLKQLCQPQGLCFTGMNDVITIEPCEMCDSRLELQLYDVTDVVTAKGPDNAAARLDQLLKVVRGLVPAENWDDAGGVGSAGSFHGRRWWLAVTQTEAVHERIAKRLPERQPRKSSK